MSSRQLIYIETDLLAKGIKVSATSRKLPNKDIIVAMENALKILKNKRLIEFVPK